MRNIVFLITGVLLIINQIAYAKHVDEQTAKQVGQTFLSGISSTKMSKSANNLELVYKVGANNSNSGDNHKKSGQTTYFYVFNAGNEGFVIVAGDDNVSPILGYSYEGAFDPNNIPPNAQKWLEGYKNEIRYVIEQEISATEQIQREWTDYYNNTPRQVRKSGSVAPLVSTKWNQGTYYNAMCPGSGNNKAVTGCVATAMAMIMKYWNYPVMGSGFRSYNSQNYGTLSANFGITTYDWNNMPNQLTASSTQTQKDAVATLMYHCGVSVNMNYSPSGSGAYTVGPAPSSEHALKTYFGYKNTLSGKNKSSYTDANWKNLLKTELNNGRPILYSGHGSGGGHAFVCDGYDDNDFFHFNWGWGGTGPDGYYAINALNPPALGTGGGSGGFNTSQQAIIGIEPNETVWDTNSNSKLKLASFLNIGATFRFISDTISLTTTIANNDTVAFNGTLGAAIFNSEEVIIGFLDTIPVSISVGSNTVRTFKRKGGPPYIPGNYTVRILYKTIGNDWTIVGNGDAINHINNKTFIIDYSALIETYSNFTVQNNGGRLIKNESASINVNLLNNPNYSTDFYGRVSVMLLNLDGYIIQTVQTRNLATDLQGGYLPPGYSIQNGFTFTGKITVEPGTYLLTLTYQRSGTDTNSWIYAGSGYYQNPVFVIVEAPLVYADKYEPNNTCATAALLPVSFSGNKATVKTTGSNFHIGTDQDFYKIDLPAGYNYTVKARLHDANNSGDGNIYYVDGLFSYSTNNCATWSDTYDDIMTNNIAIQNGGTVHFHVAPYFEGGTGTYLLEITIDRTATTSITTITNEVLRIYPNPTTGMLRVTGYQLQENTKIEIYDIIGRKQQAESRTQNEIIEIDISHLANGLYFLKVDGKTVKIVKQ